MMVALEQAGEQAKKRRRTGEGVDDPLDAINPLTPLEDRILQIMGRAVVEGTRDTYF